MAVVGMSAGGTCGARDYAGLLADELSRQDAPCTLHWLWREAESMRAAHAEIRAWTGVLASELAETRPDIVLLHYSVFAYSYRGLPLFVAPTLSALRSARAPIVTVLHEFVYPWRHGGWRGKAWAVTQRALLIDVMRRSTAVLVTTDFRAAWLATRPWLPKRRAVVAPVFSNLPPPAACLPMPRPPSTVGLFGYSYQGAAVSLVLDAIARVRDRGLDVQLVLLGAPGRGSSAAEMWLQAAGDRDLAHALSCSGTLAAQELSNALAGCEILLFADASGPSSRKGTLAASLASGRPVVAIDGPRRWLELIEADAAQVVAPTSHALAEAIHALLGDGDLRQGLGARGRAFADRRMGVERTAEALSGLIAEIGGLPRRASGEIAVQEGRDMLLR
ncbi:MAG: glycosyltransferase family 4 protein [Solirubrobacterales bacterium]